MPQHNCRFHPVIKVRAFPLKPPVLPPALTVFIPLSKSGRSHTEWYTFADPAEAFSSRYQSPGVPTVPL